MSQGSPRRSATRERPMTRPIAEPSAMAIMKAAATRASVAPEIKRECTRARFIQQCQRHRVRGRKEALPRKLGSGIPGCDQQSEREQPPAQSCLLRARPIEGAGRQRPRGANELRAADIGEDQIQGTRVRLFLSERTPDDALAVALAVIRERICIVDAKSSTRAAAIPFRTQAKISFASCVAARNCSMSGAIALGPVTIEGVTDNRDRPLRPELAHDVFHGNRTTEPSVLEIGAKIPVGQGRVSLSLQCLLRQQRRRTVDDGGLLSEIDACAQRKCLEQQASSCRVDRPRRRASCP